MEIGGDTQGEQKSDYYTHYALDLDTRDPATSFASLLRCTISPTLSINPCRIAVKYNSVRGHKELPEGYPTQWPGRKSEDSAMISPLFCKEKSVTD